MASERARGLITAVINSCTGPAALRLNRRALERYVTALEAVAERTRRFHRACKAIDPGCNVCAALAELDKV